MKMFRIFLVVIFVSNIIYTLVVGANHGWNLFVLFFGDMKAMNWAGQFNLDFMSHLMLSGLWIAWRNNYSGKGLLLGVLGTFGGILVLAPYLFVLSIKVNGDVKELFLGKVRANS